MGLPPVDTVDPVNPGHQLEPGLADAVPIDELIAMVNESLATNTTNATTNEAVALDAAAVAPLVRTYFASAPQHDLRGRTVADLSGAFLSHLRLATHRKPGQPLIRIYSPTAEDGWESPHTVIDLVLDDSPFIVTTALMALEALGFHVHLLLHPVLRVERVEGALVGAAPIDDGPAVHAEAFVHLEIDRTTDPGRLALLEGELTRAIDTVHTVVDDWQPMVERARSVAEELRTQQAHDETTSAPDLDDAIELLDWIAGGEFVLLGTRDYRYDPSDAVIRSLPDTGLGLLADYPPSVRNLDSLSPLAIERALAPEILMVAKTNARSPIHRPERMDYVGIRRHDPETGAITEHRFIGLFTAAAYDHSVTRVPVIRTKVKQIIDQCGFPPGAYDHSRLLTVLESYPRDELFQATAAELLPIIADIVHLYDRRTVRLFVRPDSFGRSVSCLIYVPRDRYRTEIREAIQVVLESAFGGATIDFETALTFSALARLYVVVAGEIPTDFDLDTLEAQLEATTRTWEDGFTRELINQVGETRGHALAARWSGAFPAGFREERPAALAVIDVLRLEALEAAAPGTVAILSYRPPPPKPNGRGANGKDPSDLRVKLYRIGQPISLSAILPILHDHGTTVLGERAYHLSRSDGLDAWIHDFGLRLPRSATENMGEHADTIRRRFEDSLLASWEQRTICDRFCRLVLEANFTWREVMLVRGLAQYLQQIRAPFTPAYVQEVTTDHPGITKLIVERFHRRLDPEQLDAARDRELAQWVLDALEAVPRLDEDRILRALNGLVDAAVRTNLYQHDEHGEPPGHLAIKFDPTTIADMPAPRPTHEIFVTSPRMEGVHLRSGAVARGGIRWSDRKEDYRTEVLALLKAQVVKNAIIVPGGAKGGFICRRLPTDEPGAVAAEVEACYRTYVEGLLDITDNLVDGEVVPPERVVRRDGDDYYLVVAADRGTATLSDVANGIAGERDFWLGDAFASGGSNGYDHKAMGITARGAWVSVRRHFSELGIDPEHDPVTVVGIGDMSGDVFGNGMLRSRTIRLVAAFDHRHIFIDPDPDPEATYVERRRLFEQPRSTWADFDRSVLSEGALIVPRTAKAVNLDERVAAALGASPGSYTPNEVISTILCAPVDLLWNGGIGTYVKASDENHASVGDRANDAVRVNADDLRCRVVGEGGNLGFTQRGRIEAALGGVRINTDAIDNSGGVNSSDREVNLKILLNQQVKASALTLTERNQLLTEMTDDIAALVLADNADQALALAASRIDAPRMAQVHSRLMAWLERHGDLDRGLEALPSDDELAERARTGTGLTQPELAVVMAYTKNVITEELVASELPDDPNLARELDRYLPAVLVERFPDAIDTHPLRRELLATRLANRVVNQGDSTLVLRLGEETSASVAETIRAHVAAWRLFDLEATWQRIEQTENPPTDNKPADNKPADNQPTDNQPTDNEHQPAGRIDPRVALEMFIATKGLGERMTRWLLRHRPQPLAVDQTVADLKKAVDQVAGLLPTVVAEVASNGFTERRDRWIASGAPPDLAASVALSPLATAIPDIVTIARNESKPLDLTTRVYFLVDDQLGLSWLRHQIDRLPRTEMWSSLARTALRDELNHEQASLVRLIVAEAQGPDDLADTLVKRWLASHQQAVERAFAVMADIRSVHKPELEHLSVGLREIRNLARRAAAQGRTTQR